MTQPEKGRLEIEDNGAVLTVRVDGGPYGVFGLDIADRLEELVDRVDRDPGVHAVVFTGAHPERFVSHAEVRWLQEEGAASPPVGRRGASAVVRTAKHVDRARVLEPLMRKTPMRGALQLERLHTTFLRMNASGVVFVAALNGSALGLGAEFAWACDLRVMADGDFFIGQPEILLGIIPGGGGTQRLTRLIGTHRSLVAILEGRPFTPAEALANGAVEGVGRGRQEGGVLRRLDAPGGRPARRTRRVLHQSPVEGRSGADARLHGDDGSHRRAPSLPAGHLRAGARVGQRARAPLDADVLAEDGLDENGHAEDERAVSRR
ncbi:enoyl-CoA hydratase/isomerase family protein [Streptomyces sp. NBC_01275]|uniref:enoyl-CoA hydratase/isomerase family protein n=1 Tax=Streptomyces sp. NBC_01275 TaxID=2903807 RepID=UPI00224D8E64|nr:enoyl-CoA hydratase/isomerase family protein [Streptomyces sp. NBC_01275]MCX4767832.1 enoyl-CoA hydratase/isomerase family protein [Streptomyces sp. NBC_01275]